MFIQDDKYKQELLVLRKNDKMTFNDSEKLQEIVKL